MNEIQLRQYEGSDQDAVWQLHVEGLKQTGSHIDDPSLDEDLHKIRKTYREFFIATINDEIIGMGALREVDQKTAEIKRMRVDPQHQGQGIGSKILDRLLQRAKELGYKKIILDTSENQAAAKRLYEKRGFKEYKRSKLGHLENIHYELNL